MKYILCIIVTMISLFGVSAHAKLTPVISQNFDSFSPGDHSGGGSRNFGSYSSTAGRWYASGTTSGSRGFIIEDTLAKSAPNALQVSRRHSPIVPACQTANVIHTASTPYVQLSVWVNRAKGGAFQLYLCDSWRNSPKGTVIYVTKTGRVRIWNSATNHYGRPSSVELPANKWVHIRWLLHYTAAGVGTFDLFVTPDGGTEHDVINEAPFEGGSRAISVVKFYPSGSNSTITFDNIVLSAGTIPKAASVNQQLLKTHTSFRTPAVFDSHGNMTINGKPTFPLGIFVALSPNWVDTDPQELETKLDDLENSPFDFLINYAARQRNKDRFQRYYQDVYKHGLVEFMDLDKLYKNIGNPRMQVKFKGTEKQALHYFVSMGKGLKGLAGWYIADEIPLDTSRIKQHSKWVKKWDSDRPTVVLTSHQQIQDIRGYAQAGDVIALDRYPIPDHGSVTLVGQAVDNMLKASSKNQPKWFVLQTFGNYVYFPKYRSKGIRTSALRPMKLRGVQRAPTPEEMRAMAYLALVHGATGLIAYYYRDINLSFDSAVRWKAVKNIFRDIQQIGPLLLAPNADTGHMKGDNPNIHWMAKQKDGKLYLIAVNSTRGLQSIWFSDIPQTIHHVKVIQGLGYADGSSKFGTNGLLITLDSFGTIVLEIN